MTTPERAAQWGIDTGYVAVRAGCLGDAGDEEIRRGLPAPPRSRATSSSIAVAELSTHDNQRVTKALNDGLQAALTGTKSRRAGDEGRAGRGRADPEAVSVMAPRRPHRRHLSPGGEVACEPAGEAVAISESRAP